MGALLKRKRVKIIIYDKGRVNGGTNYDFPGPRWVPNRKNVPAPGPTVYARAEPDQKLTNLKHIYWLL